MVVAGVELTPDNTLKKLRTACEFLKVGKTLPSAYQSQLSHLWFFFFITGTLNKDPTWPQSDLPCRSSSS